MKRSLCPRRLVAGLASWTVAGLLLGGCGGTSDLSVVSQGGGQVPQVVLGDGLGGGSSGPQPGPGTGTPFPFVPPGTPEPPGRALLSKAADGSPGNGETYVVTISDDGRYVAFQSEADNLVAGDTNGARDVFFYDRLTEETVRVSTAPPGVTEGESFGPQISGDGNTIAFTSSTQLVPEDTNSHNDVYLYDRSTDALELVSLDFTGGLAGSAPSSFFAGTITGDGRFVLFQSDADNLVPDDTNTATDAFVRDRQLGLTERLSVGDDGQQAEGASYILFQEGISDDGRYATFSSGADNLLPPGVTDSGAVFEIYLRDRVAGTTTLLSRSADGSQTWDATVPAASWMSADGETICISTDASNVLSPAVANNGFFQLYRYTRSSESFELLTGDGDGTPRQVNHYSGALSADLRYLLFVRQAPTNTPQSPLEQQFGLSSQVVLKDLVAGQERIVSGDAQGANSNGFAYSWSASLTPDASTIVFASDATNLAVQSVNTAFAQAYVAANPFQP